MGLKKALLKGGVGAAVGFATGGPAGAAAGGAKGLLSGASGDSSGAPGVAIPATAPRIVDVGPKLPGTAHSLEERRSMNRERLRRSYNYPV